MKSYFAFCLLTYILLLHFILVRINQKMAFQKVKILYNEVFHLLCFIILININKDFRKD